MNKLTALVVAALTLAACSDADPTESTTLTAESSLEATPAWLEVVDDRFDTETPAWLEVVDQRMDIESPDTAAPCKPGEESGPANTYVGSPRCRSVRRENVLPTFRIEDRRK